MRLLAGITRKILVGGCLTISVAIVLVGLGILIPRPFFIPDVPSRDVATHSPQALTKDASARRQILVLSNPIHTDIALPADPDVLKRFSFVSDAGLDLDFPGVRWVVFGWGSRAFYIETPTWGDLKPLPVLKALTWDTSVMHVRRAGDIPSDLANVRSLDLTAVNFDRLLGEIEQSFETVNADAPQEIPGAAYDAHDIFFPATGSFNALMGCNTWTARMLRSAGVQTGLWTPLPVTLDLSLELYGED
ncbi:TIGR02117 family protein [Rhodobacterales bacterium]|nr:TIGR02117 family protein [Rhodobacterales bacterium]